MLKPHPQSLEDTGIFDLPGGKNRSEGSTPPPDDTVLGSLNSKDLTEIYPFREKKAHIKQGLQLGNCYFALGLAALRESSIFDRFLRECVHPMTKNRGGRIQKGWRIRFWGADFDVDVYQDDLGKYREINRRGKRVLVGQIESKNPIDQILEVAYGRYMYLSNPEKTKECKDTYEMHDLGGFSHHFLQVVLGDHYDYDPELATIVEGEESENEYPPTFGQTICFSLKNTTLMGASNEEKGKMMGFFKMQYEKPGAVILTAATPKTGKFGKKGGFGWRRAQQGQDEFGGRLKFMDEEGRFAALHAYGIKVIHLDNDALQKGKFAQAARSLKLIVINPWNTQNETIIGWKDFLDLFRLISPVHILEEPEEPKVKYIRDSLEAGEKSDTYMYDGEPFYVGVAEQGVAINYSKNTWVLSNTVTGEIHGIPRHGFGAYEVILGRSDFSHSVSRIPGPSCSRKQCTIVFSRNSFVVHSHGRNKTNIRSRQVREEKKQSTPDEAKTSTDDSEPLWMKEGRRMFECIRDQVPWQEYKEIERASPTSIPYQLREDILEHFQDFNKGVPLYADRFKLVQTSNGMFIIFYESKGKAYWHAFDPLLEPCPRPLNESILRYFQSHAKLARTKLDSSLMVPFLSTDIQQVFEQDKGIVREMMEAKQWKILTRDNKRLVIYQYGSEGFRWQWEQSQPAKTRKAVVETISGKTEKNPKLSAALEELIAKHCKAMRKAMEMDPLPIEWTAQEIKSVGQKGRQDSDRNQMFGHCLRVLTRDGQDLILNNTNTDGINFQSSSEIGIDMRPRTIRESYKYNGSSFIIRAGLWDYTVTYRSEEEKRWFVFADAIGSMKTFIAGKEQHRFSVTGEQNFFVIFENEPEIGFTIIRDSNVPLIVKEDNIR